MLLKSHLPNFSPHCNSSKFSQKWASSATTHGSHNLAWAAISSAATHHKPRNTKSNHSFDITHLSIASGHSSQIQLASATASTPTLLINQLSHIISNNNGAMTRQQQSMCRTHSLPPLSSTAQKKTPTPQLATI
jgi:hypothetical protein